MNVILVTSRLTYVPKNYMDVLEYVVKESNTTIVGVVVIKIPLRSVIGKIQVLFLTGCTRLAKTLMKNMYHARQHRTEDFLASQHIPVLMTTNINHPSTLEWIRGRKPDLILNMRSRQIFQNTVLAIPRLGCVNIHHGLLPDQQGLYCDMYALAEHRATGFTIHEMTSAIDQGQIFTREIIPASCDYLEYLCKVAKQEGHAIVEFLRTTQAHVSLPPRINIPKTPPRITTTPTWTDLRNFQRKGILL